MKEAHRNSRRGRIWQNKWWSKVPVRFTVLNMTFVHKLMADSFPFNAFMFVCVIALLDRFFSGQISNAVLYHRPAWQDFVLNRRCHVSIGGTHLKQKSEVKTRRN
jgi:hypothetical protein